MRPQEGDRRPHHEEITIETLSTPPPRITPAPLIRRAVAAIIDSLILGTLWIVSMLVIMGAAGIPSVTGGIYSVARSLFYLFAITFVYYTLLEWIFSATIGKSVMRLRVVTKDGEPCSLAASIKRNIVRSVDLLPFAYLAGAIAILLSKDHQRIGDMVAATVVTAAPQKDINPPPAPFLFH